MADPARFDCATLRDHPAGGAIRRILAQALAAVDPGPAILRHLHRDGSRLMIGAEVFDLRSLDHIMLLAVGKAALPMAQTVLDLLVGQLVTGLVISKDPTTVAQSLPPQVEHVIAGHPIPNASSVEAGRRALAFLRSATPRDLVIGLISGGGSALMTAPREGLSLADLQQLTHMLLNAGAPIDAINTLRRRCDLVKGGGLARQTRAPISVLVVSDVLGDPLPAIASGPFIQFDDDPAAVARVLEDFHLVGELPPHLLAVLGQPVTMNVVDRPPVAHTIIANVWTAAAAAVDAARAAGFATVQRAEALAGEARVAGPTLVNEFLRHSSVGPVCLVAGGETTVTIRGDGKGGRNQEVALSMVEPLNGRDVVAVTLATDGGDGPTDAAGAVVDGSTLARAHAHALDPHAALARNDAYTFFDGLGDLLRPGPTHTNVNDLTLLCTR